MGWQAVNTVTVLATLITQNVNAAQSVEALGLLRRKRKKVQTLPPQKVGDVGENPTSIILFDSGRGISYQLNCIFACSTIV